VSSEGAEAVTDRVRRAARLLAQHKLGVAMAVLLVAAAIVGVASGSLNGAPSGRAGTPSGTSPAAAPAFALPALAVPGPGGAAPASQQVSLSQYQGKPLIVNFWASWCGPCQQETPLLASFYKANGGAVAIVGVDSNDTTARAVAFVQAKGVSYPIGVDPRLVTADAYDVAAFPQTFFLDSAHRVVDRAFGPLTRATLDKGVRLMTARDDTSGKLPVSYIQEWDGYSPGK
jgi:cytochrome c biogenesis protein CcmG/thiol:disulfide interchange protein DsbE